jgi:hypothetical protein
VILKRDTGLDISRSTMDGWIIRVGELLQPIVGVMRSELFGGSYIQAYGPGPHNRRILYITSHLGGKKFQM